MKFIYIMPSFTLQRKSQGNRSQGGLTLSLPHVFVGNTYTLRQMDAR